MKQGLERSPEDRAWIDQKRRSEVHNQLIFQGWDGSRWREPIPAKKAYQAVLRMALVTQGGII